MGRMKVRGQGEHGLWQARPERMQGWGCWRIASVEPVFAAVACIESSVAKMPALLAWGFFMDLQTWLAFFAASCLIAVSPGSGAVLSMSHGLSFGVRKTGATILGLQLGLVLILLIAGAGVGSLLLASEVAFSIVKVLGACYLIYVGFCQWRAGDKSPVQGDETESAGTWQKRCLTGFLTNATNPKGIIFMVAVLPQFMTDTRPLWTQLLVMPPPR